jgi:hypothetical protein
MHYRHASVCGGQCSHVNSCVWYKHICRKKEIGFLVTFAEFVVHTATMSSK